MNEPETNANLDDGLNAFDAALFNRAAGLPDDADLAPPDRDLLDSISNWLPGLKIALAIGSPDEPDHEPVRHDDPVAQILGLVPDQSVTLDGRKLATARKGARLDLGQLVERLRQRGWDVTISSASAWERNRINPPPATINAIANELGVETQQLLAPSSLGNDLDELFNDERIASFLGEWAHESGSNVQALREHSKRLFATAGERNATTATAETVLAILQHFKNIPGFETHQ